MSRRDWLLAAAFGLLALALLAPWPRPSIALRDACELTDAGRFAVQCDLEAAAARTGRDWLRRSLRVYEDGTALRPADRAGDVRRENPGSYHTNGGTLTLASLDRSDPRSNGRRYIVRPAEHDPLGLAGGSAPLAWGVLALGFVAACWRVRQRAAAFALATGVAVAVAGLIVQGAAVLTATPIHVDTGETLAAAEAIARGAIPYRTLLYNLYTPLGAYMFAAWGQLWPAADAPPYAWYLALVLLHETGCAWFVFSMLRRSAVDSGWAALSALSYLSMTLWFDGGRILHEPLYLLLVLAAAWLALSPLTPARALAAGALTAQAFMVKQYGGYGLLGLLALVLVAERERLRPLLLVCAGFLVGLGCWVAVVLLQGADLGALVRQSLGPSYPRRFETVWLQLFLWQCPLALFALLAPLLRGAWSLRATRVAVCFGIAACAPFVIRQHAYYFLNLCPWLFLSFALGVSRLRERSDRLRAGASLLAGALLVSIPLRAARAQAAPLRREFRGDQLRQARLMVDAWPAQAPTLLLMNPSFSFTTRYRSADEAQVGYMFVNGLPAERLRSGFQAARGVWIDPNSMYARGVDRTLREAGSSLEDQLQKQGFDRKLVLEDRFELWTKAP